MADRLLPAFLESPSGIPYGTVWRICAWDRRSCTALINVPNSDGLQVNLKYGVPPNESTVTSTAVATTHMLEFYLLSRLTRNVTYEAASRRALLTTWKHRHPTTNLLGNHIDIVTGTWNAVGAGIGGNVDSFYEYLLKGAAMFGDNELFSVWRSVRWWCALVLAHHRLSPAPAHGRPTHR